MNAKNYFTIVCRKNQEVNACNCDNFLNFLTSFPKFCPETNSVRKNFSNAIDIKKITCYTVSILFYGKEAGRMFVHIIRYITSERNGIFTGTDIPPVLSV